MRCATGSWPARSPLPLPHDAGPSVRIAMVSHPMFGPVELIGVLTGPATVEITDFATDPDHWKLIDDDPGD